MKLVTLLDTSVLFGMAAVAQNDYLTLRRNPDKCPTGFPPTVCEKNEVQRGPFCGNRLNDQFGSALWACDSEVTGRGWVAFLNGVANRTVPFIAAPVDIEL